MSTKTNINMNILYIQFLNRLLNKEENCKNFGKNVNNKINNENKINRYTNSAKGGELL